MKNKIRIWLGFDDLIQSQDKNLGAKVAAMIEENNIFLDLQLHNTLRKFKEQLDKEKPDGFVVKLSDAKIDAKRGRKNNT